MLDGMQHNKQPIYPPDVLSNGMEVVEAIINRQGEELFVINEYFGNRKDSM